MLTLELCRTGPATQSAPRPMSLHEADGATTVERALERRPPCRSLHGEEPSFITMQSVALYRCKIKLCHQAGSKRQQGRGSGKSPMFLGDSMGSGHACRAGLPTALGMTVATRRP